MATIDVSSLRNKTYETLRVNPKYSDMNNEEINMKIDKMTGMEKETFINASIYENYSI